MDAIAFLKQEHQTAKAALARVLTGLAQERGQLWKELVPELQAHEQVEEACVYEPVSRDGARDARLAHWNQEHHREVRQVERLVREIDQLQPADDGWLAKVAEVQSALERHIFLEEHQIFPRIQTVWDLARLDQAGTQMQEMKSQKMQHA